MRVAIPTADGLLCPHFGNCQQFAFIDIDQENKQILKITTAVPPQHQPGTLPLWINEHKCNLIIAGGMGGRAVSLLQQFGIEVITGAPSQKPEDIIQAYFDNTLTSGANMCDGPGFKATGGHHGCKNHGH